MVTNRNGKRVCHGCGKLTANIGAVCTPCLKGEVVSPDKNPVRLRTRPGSSKYTKEQIRHILHTYLECKLRKIPGPVKAAAERLGMKGHQVQHVILYYRKVFGLPSYQTS